MIPADITWPCSLCRAEQQAARAARLRTMAMGLRALGDYMCDVHGFLCSLQSGLEELMGESARPALERLFEDAKGDVLWMFNNVDGRGEHVPSLLELPLEDWHALDRLAAMEHVKRQAERTKELAH